MQCKIVNGFCDFANEDRSIEVKFVEETSLDSLSKLHKSRFTRCSGCNSDICPLYEKQPD